MSDLSRKEAVVRVGAAGLRVLRHARQAIYEQPEGGSADEVLIRARGIPTTICEAPASPDVIMHDAHEYCLRMADTLLAGMTGADPEEMIRNAAGQNDELCITHGLGRLSPMTRHSSSFIACDPTIHMNVLTGHTTDRIVEMIAGNPEWFDGKTIDPSKGKIVVAAPMAFGWLLASLFARAHAKSAYAQNASVEFVGVATHADDYGSVPKLPAYAYPEKVEGDVIYVMDDLKGQTLDMTKRFIRQKFPGIVPGFA